MENAEKKLTEILSEELSKEINKKIISDLFNTQNIRKSKIKNILSKI